MYRTLNGKDRDARITTFLTLCEATYQCNDGTWPAGNFIHSSKWKKFPGHIKAACETITQQHMAITPRNMAKPIWEWSIETLMCLTGQETSKTRRLTNILNNHNKSKLADISPWFQGGEEAWINRILEDRNHGEMEELIDSTMDSFS
jgi:hypothetical protein